MNISGIYKIMNITTSQIYIGSSQNLIKRQIQHFAKLRLLSHSNPKLQYSYNKYKIDSFKFEVLEYCDINDLLLKEQYYINTLKPYFNIAKIAESPMKGRSHSEESKKKLSLANKSKQNCLGYKHSKEVRDRKSKNCKFKKSVLQYDLDENFIKEWESTKSIRSLFVKNICITHISDCCKNRRKTAYGFIWKYKETSY